MKLVTNTFAAAIEYLAAFGDENSPLVFRPWGDRVIIAIHGRAFAEYQCHADAPLKERFAMPLRMAGRLVKTLPEDQQVVFKIGNVCKMSVGSNDFVSPLLDLNEVPEPPKVIDGVMFTWGADVLVPELKTAMSETSSGKSGDGKECVCIEVLPARETIVATNGHLLGFYEAKANRKNTIRRDDGTQATVLIHRSNVALILATCKSMGPVDLEVGLSEVVVECGRRKCVVPIHEGAFPVWRDAIVNVLNMPRTKVILERDEVIHAIRQVRPEAEMVGGVTMTVRANEVEFVAESDTGSLARTVIRSDKRLSPFGPMSVSAKYLLGVAQAWPEGVPFEIQYRGKTKPIVFRRSRFRALLMPLIPKELECDASENDARRIATVRSGEPGRAHSGSPVRQRIQDEAEVPAHGCDAGDSGKGGSASEAAGIGAAVVAPERPGVRREAEDFQLSN